MGLMGGGLVNMRFVSSRFDSNSWEHYGNLNLTKALLIHHKRHQVQQQD